MKQKASIPKLYLAPMEGVGNRAYRKAMATIGGFDEASTEFLRVPSNAHVESLAKAYDPNDTYPIPQAAQIMGSDRHLMARMCVELHKRGAHRIELNCGCPSNTVTGRGAGSSLLKDPEQLYLIAKAMVDSVPVPITIKLRSGYDDTSLFSENIHAAAASGAVFITLHPRTKKQGYTAKADWSLIAKAKSLIDIPVVGNGDIVTPDDAIMMLKETGCDALMIGRGAIMNPWIFHEVKTRFGINSPKRTAQSIETFISTYIDALPEKTRPKNRINQLKQLAGFLYLSTQKLKEKRSDMLRHQYVDTKDFVDRTLPFLKNELVC